MSVGSTGAAEVRSRYRESAPPQVGARASVEAADLLVLLRAAMRSVEAIFQADVRTPRTFHHSVESTDAGFASLPDILIQEASSVEMDQPRTPVRRVNTIAAKREPTMSTRTRSLVVRHEQ